MGQSGSRRVTRFNTSSPSVSGRKHSTRPFGQRVRYNSKQDGESHDILKVVIVGERNTGKTNVMTRFARDSYTSEYVSTVGVDVTARTIEVDGEVNNLQIWGISREIPVSPHPNVIFRKASGVMIMFSVTNRSTYEKVGEHWVNYVKQYAESDTFVMLLGNKCDLEEERTVSYSEAQDFAWERSIPYIDVSAKDGTNVELAFVRMAARIRQSHESRKRQTVVQVAPTTATITASSF